MLTPLLIDRSMFDLFMNLFMITEKLHVLAVSLLKRNFYCKLCGFVEFF